MADTETLERVKSRRVQVANLSPADSGRGIARLPAKLMEELALSEGDTIEIVGKRSTAARAIRVAAFDFAFLISTKSPEPIPALAR